MSTTRSALVVATVLLSIVGFVAILAAIWTGDERWGSTAFLLLISATTTGLAASFPGWPE